MAPGSVFTGGSRSTALFWLSTFGSKTSSSSVDEGEGDEP